ACVRKKTQEGEPIFDLVVRHYEPGKNLTATTHALKNARLAGSPALFGNSLLIPLDNSSLLRQSLDGRKSDFGPGWRARQADEGARGYVVPLRGDDFLTTDGSRGLSRWHWPADDVYKLEKRIDLPQRLVAAPLVIPGMAGNDS